MNFVWLLLFLLLTFPSYVYPAGTCWNGGKSAGGTSPWTVLDGDGGSASAAVADISYCVNTAAAVGETVLVTAAAATWTTSLVITQAVTLQGTWDGSTGTTITGQVNSSYKGVISYESPATSTTTFRLTGFKIDNTGYTARALTFGVAIEDNESGYTTKVRIDNNSLKSTSPAIAIYGVVYGVVDNNTITGSISYENPGNYTTWDTYIGSIAYGGEDSIYYEDNVINVTKMAFSTGAAGRYVARYNTVNITTNGMDVADAHGNMASGNASTMITEIYGNQFTNAGLDGRAGIIRGGRSLLFFNNSTANSAVIKVWEEWHDATYDRNSIAGGEYISSSGTTLTSTNNFFPADAAGKTTILIVDGAGKGESKAITGYTNQKTVTIESPFVATLDNTSIGMIYYTSGTYTTREQHVNNTYIFNNLLNNTTNIEAGILGDTFWYDGSNDVYNNPYTIAENRDFWQQRSTGFDGSFTAECQYRDSSGTLVDTCESGGAKGGVGCGTRAARPITCTVGAAYWATDQSCSDLTGLVGVDPATPIAGTLYKCTATDTWTAYYQPYTYPHPLRGEATTHTVTSSKTGAGTLSYEGEYVLNDGGNSLIYTATPANGWKVTWSGTGGCTGNGTTCQVLNVTGDVTVIATFSEIKLMPW